MCDAVYTALFPCHLSAWGEGGGGGGAVVNASVYPVRLLCSHWFDVANRNWLEGFLSS